MVWCSWLMIWKNLEIWPRLSMAGAMVATWVPCVWPRPSRSVFQLVNWHKPTTAWREWFGPWERDIRWYQNMSEIYVINWCKMFSTPIGSTFVSFVILGDFWVVSHNFNHAWSSWMAGQWRLQMCSGGSTSYKSGPPAGWSMLTMTHAVGHVEAMVSDCKLSYSEPSHFLPEHQHRIV